ncbi:hypothetical protein AOQ84DRAFT_388040 [Glonium stellatum]|uniref:TLC domain-containing protein n=1 Tax=Glonium stellatum TaxID=574774 RepID=A0A8E2F323_9PEZI|nr:hypothetical protein AOQ84DRAFT_388040 [Glonium stellatum]
MQDPIPPAVWVREFFEPVGRLCNLPALPNHAHQILISLLFYTCAYKIAPSLFSWLFPSRYGSLNKAKRHECHVDAVSLTQSTINSLMAVVMLYFDTDRKDISWVERVWGFNEGNGLVMAISLGYFIWHFVMMALHVHHYGRMMLLHGFAACFVVLYAYRPLLIHYGPIFLVYEFSNPFLNLHRFFEKFGKHGTQLQLINGIILIVVFFFCRIVWGTYHVSWLYRDMWAAVRITDENLAAYQRTLAASQGHGSSIIYVPQRIPAYFAVVHLGCNTTLLLLCYYWFCLILRKAASTLFPTAKNHKEGGSAEKPSVVMTRDGRRSD